MLLPAARLVWATSLPAADELVAAEMVLELGEAFKPVTQVDALADEEEAALAAASPSSSADAELAECVLLCRSWGKRLAIEEPPEDEKSF